MTSSSATSCSGYGLAFWNINGGHIDDGSRRMTELELANPIAEMQPDVIGLVEVPFSDGKPRVEVTRVLEEAGLSSIFSARLSESHLDQSDGLGLVLASSYEIGDGELVLLPELEVSARNRLVPHPKGLLMARVRLDRHTVLPVVVVHLPPFHMFSLASGKNQVMLQLRSIVEGVDKFRREHESPFVLGDFNLSDRSLIADELDLVEQFARVETRTAGSASDDILVPARIKVVERGMQPTSSDHFALMVRCSQRSEQQQ